MRRQLLAAAAAIVILLPALHAQKRIAELSGQEEDDIRDAASSPVLRVATYQKIIDTRIRRIQQVAADRRAQGRREDIHEALSAITSISDELQDNLDDYETAHRDLRKQLPKLIADAQRWQSLLKQVPEDDSYRVVGKLALEAVGDVRQDAEKMLAAEMPYFKEHPPDPRANPGGIGPVAVPKPIDLDR